ncbi:sensor domain-containing diguanylate cyclase [Megalodesulfovibrio paquesii]
MCAATPTATRRLSRQILGKVLLLGVLIVSVATIAGYYLVYDQSRSRRLAALRLYMQERQQQENQPFLDASDKLSFFRDEFLRLYTSGLRFSDEDFWRQYFVDKDGATRMREAYFQEQFDPHLGRVWGMSSFIGNNQPVDSVDFRRRLLLANILVSRYGPAWQAEGMLHASFPENALTIFSPDDPWGLKARPDLPMNELGTIKATLQSVNPERTPVWTGLYYDETAARWAITFELPVDYQGRHLINPSLDMPLEAIMLRLEVSHPAGASNLIVSKDGYLIAHPGTLSNELKKQGQLSMEKIDNPDIVRMYHVIANSPASAEQGVFLVEDEQGGNYLFVAPLAGPGWWFVTVYPKALIASEANHTAQIVLALGFLLFVLYSLVVYSITVRQVEQPLQRLQHAVSLVADGQHEAVVQSPRLLPLEQQNEIGQFATMFQEMCKDVMESQANLQHVVEHRTQELEDAVAKLRALSLLDGLTGIHNRRSFDRDLAAVFAQAGFGVESFNLMLMDVDNFKHYNDMYGHTAGDEVLRKVAETIAASIRKEDRVYRYGGEEMTILFNTTDAEAAREFSTRILDAVQALRIPHAGSPHDVVTVSAGLVAFDPSFPSATAMVDAADARLYAAKARGKNQLCSSAAC